jgi:hypothetical protein
MQWALVEAVPLSEDNQNWVRGEIRQAIHPSGWRKAADVLRYWGVLGVIITAFLALIAIVITLGIFATNKISQESEFRGTTGERLKNIESNLKTLSVTVDEIRLKQVSNNAADPQNIKDAQNVLHTAQSTEVAFTTDAIADAGKKFVSATKSNPDAWNAVVEFLNYRAYLNSVTIQLGPQVPPPATFGTIYETHDDNFPGKVVSLRWIGISKPPDVPQLHRLSNPDLNKNAATGPSLLVVDAPVVILDNLYAKKVVFRNSHVIYRGGPASLDSVYFLNCTFEIDRKSNGQELANQIVSGPVTTFMIAG